MEEAFPMNGGDGAYSYSKNSQFQKGGSDTVKGMIHEAVIENLDIEEILSSTPTVIKIADLGCSIGPNTFLAVQNLIQGVQTKIRDSTNDQIEFQVFFNDHIGNDFNTLFASLPSDRQYHAAGVPGSFHGRLFPGASINLAYSSNSLSWLSKQPQLEVANEGRILYSGAPEDVVRAYSDQFERDMGSFMSARAVEMVSGGLMLLVMAVTPDHGRGASYSDLHANVMFDFLGHSLMDLVNEGVVEKSAVDGFNFPVYFPTVGEVQKEVEKNGCFSIERTALTNPFTGFKGAADVGGLIMQLRAATEGILTAYFGNSVVEKMFGKMMGKSDEISVALEAGFRHPTLLLLVLKRRK